MMLITIVHKVWQIAISVKSVTGLGDLIWLGEGKGMTLGKPWEKSDLFRIVTWSYENKWKTKSQWVLCEPVTQKKIQKKNLWKKKSLLLLK